MKKEITKQDILNQRQKKLFSELKDVMQEKNSLLLQQTEQLDELNEKSSRFDQMVSRNRKAKNTITKLEKDKKKLQEVNFFLQKSLQHKEQYIRQHEKWEKVQEEKRRRQRQESSSRIGNLEKELKLQKLLKQQLEKALKMIKLEKDRFQESSATDTIQKRHAHERYNPSDKKHQEDIQSCYGIGGKNLESSVSSNLYTNDDDKQSNMSLIFERSKMKSQIPNIDSDSSKNSKDIQQIQKVLNVLTHKNAQGARKVEDASLISNEQSKTSQERERKPDEGSILGQASQLIYKIPEVEFKRDFGMKKYEKWCAQ